MHSFAKKNLYMEKIKGVTNPVSNTFSNLLRFSRKMALWRCSPFIGSSVETHSKHFLKHSISAVPLQHSLLRHHYTLLLADLFMQTRFTFFLGASSHVPISTRTLFTFIIPSLESHYCTCTVLVRYLYGTCTVLVRYLY